MKTIRVRNFCQILLLALLLPAITQVARSTTIAWTNTLGGNWSVAANWNPNQVPGPGDTANITNAGTYAVTLNVNVTVLNLAIGGATSGIQTLQGNGFTFAVTNADVNGGGVLALNNSSVSGALTIAGGGVLNDSGETINGQVTVQSGGAFLANANITLGGDANSSNEWLWVQSGGLMNTASGAPITSYIQMTNAGTMNLTNYGITTMYNPGNSPNYTGGLLNQAGGIINLIGTAGISGNGGFDVLQNQGTINVTNGTSTISVDSVINQGTVATLPGTGTLTIGKLNGLGTLSGTYNAAAGTTIKFVSNNNPGTSPGAGLTLAGSGQFQFTTGLLTLSTNVIPNLALDGGILSLGAGFQGGAITNLVLNGINLTNTLPITGALVMTNGTLAGTIIIVNNGLLQTAGSVTVQAQTTVENGAEFLADGNVVFGGDANSTNEWLWVQSGGLMNTGSGAPVTLYVQTTNAGTLNFTNYGINSLYNPGSGPNYVGGLINQAGGFINLIGTAGISGSGGFDVVLNQGTINVTNGSSSISVDTMINQGTVTTLPGTGTLSIGIFNGLGALSGTFNAAAGTIIRFVSNNNPGTSPGAGLVLGGSGQYQFASGLLTLTNNIIPNLALNGGTLLLGPAFQGGAITNLALNGISLTNTLPITGALAMTNGTLYGTIVVVNNGLLLTGSATVDAQVTVESGGELSAVGGVTFGGNANTTNEWLWVQSGGLLNASSVAPITLYVQMTNAGLLNLTNDGITTMYNPGSGPNYDGGLLNQAGGIINLIGTAGISGNGGFDVFQNLGTVNVTNGSSSIRVDNMLNQGTVATLPGTGTLIIGNFNGLGTLTGTYNAAPGTIIQFVSNSNPGTSPGAGLTLGGTGQYQFTSGLLTLTNNTVPSLALDGGTLLLGPVFQGGAITNLTLNGMNLTNTLPVTGTFVMTNGTLYGTIIIASNAVLQTGGSLTVDAQVTVENGGELLAKGTVVFGGDSNSTNEWVWVQAGGLINASQNAPINLYVQTTNAGTLNFTNYGINSLYNPGTSPNYDGGLVNQAAGIINLIGTAGISGSGGSDFVLNQGTIDVTNGSSSIRVDNMFNQGTVATLPGTGTLIIGNFNGLGTLTGTYNAAPGTIIQFVSNNNPGTSPGAGLTLSGSGQFQFTTGLLTLPTNVVPNMALDGGILSLGAGFQGGAVTNLTIFSTILTNALPITGTLVMTNGTLTTTNTLSNGALLSLNNTTLIGSIFVANNGVLLTGGSAVVDAQVTVENGGQLLAYGGTSFGGNANSTNEWLWVQSGGFLNAASSAPLNVYFQMTNAGTFNLTNYGINSLYNPGSSPNYDGGVVNLATGTINLIEAAAISGSGGFDFVLNQGAINILNDNSAINVDNFTNFGILNAELWTLQLQSTNINLLSASSLDIALAGPATYGNFNIHGKAALTGGFNVSPTNGYIPVVGTAFIALTNGPLSGHFTSFSLPPHADIAWQPVYSTNAVTLIAQPLIALLPSGTNVMVSLNGTPGQQAIELTSTNLKSPLASWTPVSTNTIDVTTYLGLTNNIDPTRPRQFFTFQLK